jgi:hypothetical protein
MRRRTSEGSRSVPSPPRGAIGVLVFVIGAFIGCRRHQSRLFNRHHRRECAGRIASDGDTGDGRRTTNGTASARASPSVKHSVTVDRLTGAVRTRPRVRVMCDRFVTVADSVVPRSRGHRRFLDWTGTEWISDRWSCPCRIADAPGSRGILDRIDEIARRAQAPRHRAPGSTGCPLSKVREELLPEHAGPSVRERKTMTADSRGIGSVATEMADRGFGTRVPSVSLGYVLAGEGTCAAASSADHHVPGPSDWSCREAGVKVMMVTSDPPTALAIARGGLVTSVAPRLDGGRPRSHVDRNQLALGLRCVCARRRRQSCGW